MTAGFERGITLLIKRLGIGGYGIYWAIIQQCEEHHSGGLPTDALWAEYTADLLRLESANDLREAISVMAEVGLIDRSSWEEYEAIVPLGRPTVVSSSSVPSASERFPDYQPVNLSRPEQPYTYAEKLAIVNAAFYESDPGCDRSAYRTIIDQMLAVAPVVNVPALYMEAILNDSQAFEDLGHAFNPVFSAYLQGLQEVIATVIQQMGERRAQEQALKPTFLLNDVNQDSVSAPGGEADQTKSEGQSEKLDPATVIRDMRSPGRPNPAPAPGEKKSWGHESRPTTQLKGKLGSRSSAPAPAPTVPAVPTPETVKTAAEDPITPELMEEYTLLFPAVPASTSGYPPQHLPPQPVYQAPRPLPPQPSGGGGRQPLSAQSYAAACRPQDFGGAPNQQQQPVDNVLLYETYTQGASAPGGPTGSYPQQFYQPMGPIAAEVINAANQYQQGR